MSKRVSLVLALALVIAMMIPSFASAEEMTDVGTPRAQTLICEPDADVYANPGQFNPYMTGTAASWGMHQIMWADGLWDVNTMTGETISTVAADLATPNEDYTEWTIQIREGLKWSDGEVLDANDVYFTFNMIMTTEGIGDYAFYNSLFEGAEVIDDYTMKVYCKAPFPRIMTTLGVNMWGCGFRIVPEHVYSQVEDVLSFRDEAPLAVEQYVVKDYDELGTWILYEKRADWDATPTGILFGEPAPQYILYRVFGNTESRVMAMISNQVDVMNEVSYEDLLLMLDSSESVRAWYEEFPYANTDDACSKGPNFNCGIAPFDDVNVRWALTLCCDWIEVTQNVFEGIGRMSPMVVPSITAMENMYVKPMSDWLNEFTIGDTGIKVWDPDIASKIATSLIEDYGYDLGGYSEEEIKVMFGNGYYRTDVEAATELLLARDDFELVDGKWYWNGEPWTIEVLVHPEDSSTQAARSSKAVADQWSKFGITVEVTTLTGADIGTRTNLGDFQVNDNWPNCSAYVQDFYNNITGWNTETFYYELGETATGVSAYRMYLSEPELAAQITEVVKAAANVDPKGEECYDLMTEFLKLTFEMHYNIPVHAGTKIVPINEAYWTGFPTAENPYEGPWWWWSNFKFTIPRLEAAQ
jgi:peptide/nickel transport system substrate-binding protein